MNLLAFIQKELHAAWYEATYPLFPVDAVNDCFYTELSNYYDSCKGKVIDTNSGESLFPPTTGVNEGHLHMTKAQRQNRSEASAPADFLVRNWKPV
ncbi:MAG: hypothetical protein M0Q44_08060 [Methylobacter sp.]|jgi:hypothetical protein|nr:hypothetical protein [Methylobacter sp.]